MTKEEMKKLVKLINRNFGPPFLEKGTVQAKMERKGAGFSITIGRRDVSVDSDLNVTGAGTCLR